ncbi:MAG: sugar transferase [Acholeplasmatales bacterium]|nr:sugar transferase [Acholeplasmatales bacterium]
MRKSTREALSLEYNIGMFKKKPFLDFIKRCFDIFMSLFCIILLSWLFLIIAILIKCTSRGPVLYGHERVGKNGSFFKVWKFRSMRVDNRPIEEILTKEQLEEYKNEFKVTNDPRVTKIGKLLRKSSIDELPQLFNILFGNMSFVGWRPILKEEWETYYGANKDLLVMVKPGLTGYWACHGRSQITYKQRVKMELYYVVKRSVWLDIRILWHTVFKVAMQEGAE